MRPDLLSCSLNTPVTTVYNTQTILYSPYLEPFVRDDAFHLKEHSSV